MRPTKHFYSILLLCTIGCLFLVLLFNTRSNTYDTPPALNEPSSDGLSRRRRQPSPTQKQVHPNKLRIITLDQVKNRWKRLCENDCSDNGVCLLGQCFCKPGFDGSDCSRSWKVPPKACVLGKTDVCFYHHSYGVAQVSMERWRYSQSFEQDTWATRDTDNDQNEGHADSYDNYSILPDNLGKLIEIGAGPFTQTKTIL